MKQEAATEQDAADEVMAEVTEEVQKSEVIENEKVQEEVVTSEEA